MAYPNSSVSLVDHTFHEKHLISKVGEGFVGDVYVFDHPLIQHKLTYIRNTNTGTKEFRELVDEVAKLMAFEITRKLPVKDVKVQTPVAKSDAKVLAGKKLGVIPILRAGLGMVD